MGTGADWVCVSKAAGGRPERGGRGGARKLRCAWAAAPTPQGSYNKAARYPVYAPGPVTYHRYQAPAQVPYRTQQVVRTPAQIPVQYQQQQVIATERPVVYEAAVLPVVKNVYGAQQQYYAQSQTMAQQQMMQPSQHAQTAQSAASYYAQ